MPETPITYNYYPKLSELITLEDLPEILNFLKEGLQEIFDKIYYKDFQSSRNVNGSRAFYSLDIVSRERLDLELPGTEIFIILNPDFEDSTISSFPIQVYWEWPILRYLRYFNANQFSFSLAGFYDLALQILNISESKILELATKTFVVASTPGISKFQQLVDDINNLFGSSISIDETTETRYQQLAVEIDLIGQQVAASIFTLYLFSNDSQTAKNKLNYFFSTLLPGNIESYIKELILPKARITLALSAALEFPRNMLTPVYPEGTTIGGQNISYQPIPAPEKAIFSFAEALFYADTTQGIGYNMDLSLSTTTPVQIGNTGLILNINNLKIDLSTNSNFPEANDDGRPLDFMGVYTQQVDIILPSKWFANDEGVEQTLKISGKHLLIGNGGISGIIALEALIPGNPIGINDILWVSIGSSDGFKVGFKKFDIVFKQNKIVSSNLSGLLELRKLTYPAGHPDENTPIKIGIEGHLDENGGFNLTATAQDLPVTFPDVFTYNLKTVELGRDSDNAPFYIGTSGTLQFEGFLKESLHLGPIEIQSLRIYSDGSMEFSGGSIALLEPVVLKLGPVDITVTAIHYGSHQKEVNGVMRKFNYFGFDGGLSVDPLGVEIRGDGVKLYYCIDDLEPKIDPYLHIQTIYLDLTIPSKSPAAIINGWISIPEPGISQEYAGGLKLQLPKVKVTGSVDMKLAPRYPAFILDASIEFPAPIPMGTFALYGFRGLLGYRYVAEKEAIGLVSHTNSWYEYYKKPPQGIHVQKFRRPEETEGYGDPFSIGAGASLGTSFDNGTVLNLKVMLLLSVPSLFMLDGRAGILSARLGLEATKEPPFFAMAAIGNDSLELGFGADFQMPTSSGSMLDLYAEMQAAFYFNDSSKWFVHFGTKEKPTLAKILSLIELKSYLMLSAKGIEAGARGEFDFKRTYAGIIKVHAWAYIEVGGKISFERPQFGAYLDAGVGAEIKVKFVDLSASFDILFSVEASEPFLIYGRVRITIKIRIAWVFKFRFNAEVEVLWEKSKVVSRLPLNPLIAASGNETIPHLAKGVNMLSNEVFDLAYLGQVIISDSVPPNEALLKTIIPLDTYIDIKTEKGLLPSSAISALIGGYTNPATKYTDLIPPDNTIKGKALRQVKHQYTLESLSLKFWRPAGNNQPAGWQAYHPYKALYPNDNTPQYNNLKIGQFQKTDGQYNTVRLLATTPFSYTEQGEPGWYIPEQYGLTAATLFCEGEEMPRVCAHFLSKPLGQQYFCFDQNHMFYSNEAAFLVIDKEDEEYAFVTNHPNTFGFAQSLAFNVTNKLQIILPEPSVLVTLKITSDSQAVRIRYYSRKIDDNALEVQYGHPNPAALNQNTSYTVIVSAANLNQAIEYNRPTWMAISKIIVEPVIGNRVLISSVSNQISLINNLNLQNELGVIQWFNQSPIAMRRRLDQLEDNTGELTIYNYVIDTVNNRYMDRNDGKWVTSWDPKKDQKIAENTIGFNLKGNKLTIESDYQLVDFELLPNIGEVLVVDNGGLRAELTVKDISKYLNANGYLTLNAELYENCLRDKRLCTLRAQLGAINSTFISPATIRPENFPAMQRAFTRFKELPADLDSKYPEYKLQDKFANQIKDIDSFILYPDTKTYDLAFGGASSVIGVITQDGGCCADKEAYWQLYLNIQDIFQQYFQDIEGIKDYTELIRYIQIILDLLQQFQNQYPASDILKDLAAYIAILQQFLNTQSPQTAQDAVGAIEAILDYLNHHGAYNFAKLPKKTLLHEVCWLSLEAYQYNQNIPQQPAISADAQATVAGITQYIQPIWRPATSYILQFRLKDTVDNGLGQGTYDFAFGFTTAGPVGYFHTDPASTYGDIIYKEGEKIGNFTIPELSILDDANGILRRYDDNTPYGDDVNDNITPHPDSYALTSLKRYIDYERSYPYADGNLLSAKPLFYDDNHVSRVFLFFNKTYATHFFNDWPSYQGSTAIAGRIKIIIKDPSENDLLVNPPYLDYDPEDVTTINIPQTEEVWENDENPLMSIAINKWANLYNTPGHCIVTGGNPIKPASSYIIINLKNLKPSKLYTAIVNNLYDMDGNNNFDELSEMREVHKFGFQTSRYANFAEQINSYQLSAGTGEDYVEKQAIFTIRQSFTTQQINDVYNTVIGAATPADALIPKYQHAFDRVLEGILGLRPLDPPISTEFNIIKNAADGNIIAILVRSPEPFNIPKIPVEQMSDAIEVFVGGVPSTAYKVLHSKDYSQAFIMHSSKIIQGTAISIKFRFKMWNGSSYYNLNDNLHPPITISLV